MHDFKGGQKKDLSPLIQLLETAFTCLSLIPGSYLWLISVGYSKSILLLTPLAGKSEISALRKEYEIWHVQGGMAIDYLYDKRLISKKNRVFIELSKINI